MKRLLVLITLSVGLFLQITLIPTYGFAEVPASQIVPLAQPVLPSTLPKNAITWPLLPNESIASLATLFYPNNAEMQTRFIARTVALNSQALNTQQSRGLQFNSQTLNPYAKTQQVTLIVIPELKSLSSAAGEDKSTLKHMDLPKNVRAPWKNPLQMSYSLKDGAQFIVNPKLVAAYDDLVKRNEFLKVELQKLNDRLSKLQSLMVTLKAEAIRILSMPVVQSPVSDVEVDLLKLAKKPAKIAKATMPLNNASALEKTNTVNYLLMGLLAVLSIIICIITFKAYRQHQLKYLDLTAAGLFKPLETGQFKSASDLTVEQGGALKSLDFSLTKSGFVSNLAEHTGEDIEVNWGETEVSVHQQEGDQILEEARIFVNIGRVDEAVELLKAQIKAMPKTSLHHWLYLLDIFRDRHQQDEFISFAKQLHENFNVMMPQWDNEPLGMVMSSSLEQFAHIVETLTSLWGKENGYLETKAYLEELLTDNREKERAGFSMQVFQEIVLLTEVLEIREKLAHHSD